MDLEHTDLEIDQKQLVLKPKIIVSTFSQNLALF
jgi:hypothetical protein